MPNRRLLVSKGQYRARLGEGAADLSAAQGLRSVCFGTDLPDQDRFDARCAHVLVEDLGSGRLVCCFRLLLLADGRAVADSYSAQFYALGALQDFAAPMAEMGRFCMHPEWGGPDILRIAWAAMTRIVDSRGIEMLFGCSSFMGRQTTPYLDAFALLKHRYLAPTQWQPQVKAPEVYRYAAQLQRRLDAKSALAQMPPLLRSYLIMGGWVSDHAVIDAQMNTLHVFTGLEIGAISPNRKRLLRAVAG